MIIAPLAVLPLACAAGAVGWLAGLGDLPPLAVGLLMVRRWRWAPGRCTWTGWPTRSTVSGRAGTATRSLAIMARGDVGPMGVVALVITLGLQAAALGELVTDLRGALLAGADHLRLPGRAGPGLRPRGAAGPRPGLGAAVAGSVPARSRSSAGWRC